MKFYTYIAATALAVGLAASPAQAITTSFEETMEVVNVDLTTGGTGEPISFDLNGDGIDDFKIEIFSGGDEGEEFAVIDAIFNEINLEAGVGIDSPIVASAIADGGARLIGPEQFVTVYNEGDVISDNFRDYSFSGQLYTNDGTGDIGPFAEIGSTGFIGLYVVDSFEDLTFGFAEITRGSITVGQVGRQTQQGAPAVVTSSVSAVPLPAALPLLLGAMGLFGFMGWRRKKPAAVPA